MNIPEKKEAPTIEEKLKAYCDLKLKHSLIQKELDEMKLELDNEIQDDLLVIENVGQFKRKAASVRKLLDKKKVEQMLPPEQYEACFKESSIKGAVEIVSWDTLQLRKQIAIEKNRK